MEKEKTINFIGSIIIFFVLLFVYSKWGPAIPLNINTQVKGEPFVVSANGKVSVAPDTAKLTIGMEETGSSLKNVQSSVNTKSKDLVSALKELGIKEESIKTVNYNVYPEYDYQSSTRRITGYRVSTTYEITVKDFEKINDVLSLSTQKGANVVGGISFEVNDETRKEKLQEAREIAVKEAKEKATGMTKAANITLGKIINISENQGVSAPRPVYLEKSTASGGGLDAAMPQPDIQPGQTEIEVTISLSYELR